MRTTIRISVVVCTLVAIFSTATLCAQQSPSTSVFDHATPLAVGRSLTIHSSILDENRRLLIYCPPDYETNDQPMPVIYLLDGRANFQHTAATVDLLVVNARMPRSMVVAIANTDRDRDFTAVVTDRRSSGGADRFLEFIETELIPFIEREFNTAEHRTVIGHSLGGLFVMHALVERSDLFDAAIVISPAVTNDERVGDGSRPISKRLDIVLEARDTWPLSLFVTMSDGEDARWTTDFEPILDALRSKAPSDLRWEFRQMVGEDHGTTVLGSTYHGLRYINEDWDTSGLVREGDLDALVERFESLSRRLGFAIQPPEMMVNLVGYRLLGEERMSDAIDVFESNVELYPESANVHDSLGEALELSGKLPGALRSYRRAVKLAQRSNDARLPIFESNLQRVESLLEDAPGAGGLSGLSIMESAQDETGS